MALSIKSEATEKLARQVAQTTGESITEAIRVALEERQDRLRQARSGRTLANEVSDIIERYKQLPVSNQFTDDELLGYDEFGAPTR